jgi:hypothetical protein
MNPSFFPEFENEFKLLRFIHFGLVMGLAVFITIVLNFAVDDSEATFDLLQIESLIGMLLGLSSIIIGWVLFNSRVRSNSKIKKQKERFDNLKTAHIISWALLEAAAMFNVVIYLSTANGISILVGTIITGILLYSRPKKEWVQSKLTGPV